MLLRIGKERPRSIFGGPGDRTKLSEKTEKAITGNLKIIVVKLVQRIRLAIRI